MKTTLFVKYGSRITSGIAELVYDRILMDPELAPFFRNSDMDVLREHLADFLTVATGGPDIYRGKDIRTAHRGIGISAAHFNRLVDHIQSSAKELGCEEADIETLLKVIRGTEASVVEVG